MSEQSKGCNAFVGHVRNIFSCHLFLSLLLVAILAGCEGAAPTTEIPPVANPDDSVTDNSTTPIPAPTPTPSQPDELAQPEFTNLSFVDNAASQTDGVIVKFRSTLSSASRQLSLFAAGCNQTATFPLVNGLTHARITTPGQTVTQTILNLSQDPDVEYVEPNYIVSRQAIPNDPQFTSLHGLNNTGQTGGTADADIDAPEAWDIETGNSNPVLVAVLDSGIDFNHQDLQSNIWRNPNEVANNGVDDDGNGFVDDINGWDFVNNDNNPQDDLNHGTHVSGTIAAVGNNGIGVTGVSWTAQILPVKFLNRFGQGSTANAIRALNYAVALGARVSNLSYGGTAFSQALYDTIAAANNAGHIVVAAAGNSSNNSDNFPVYPAAYNLPNIISVAATNASDQLANFSNFGPTTIDLAAPGVNTLSTVPFNNYATMNGTSMSTPHVTGVVSLLLAKLPSLTAADVKSALLTTVDPLPSLAGRTVSGGRVNAFQALSTLAPQISVTTVNGMIEFAVSETTTLVASGGSAPYVWSSSNPSVAMIDAVGNLTALAPGVVQITATDNNNNSGTSAAITVTQITITPNSGSVGVGQSLRFSATGGVAPYSYSVNNSAVASINAITGELTALAVGNTTVNVIDNAGNSVSSSTITVSDISLTPQTGLIGVGDSLQFNATGGVPPFNWSSTNPAVASIDTSGLLSGLASGTTTVSVTDSLGMMVNSGVVEVRAVSVAPQSGTLLIGDSLQLSTSGGNPPYTWTVSDTTIATIDANGLLTASAVGTITASVADADGFATTTGSITVTDVVVTIDVSPAIASVNRFNWVLFSAIGGTGPYTFSLSNPAAGFINSTTGWFRATGAIGITTSIIATDANGDQGESGVVTINGFGHH